MNRVFTYLFLLIMSVSYPCWGQSTPLSLTNFTYGPNPFYQTTQGHFTIQVQPSIASTYELYIFDMSRHLVFQDSGTLSTNLNSIQWNGFNLVGKEVSTGPYMGILFVKNGSQLIKKRIPIGYFQ